MTIGVIEIRSGLEPIPDDDSPLENGLKSIADDADLCPVRYWSSDRSDCPDCFFLQTLADDRCYSFDYLFLSIRVDAHSDNPDSLALPMRILVAGLSRQAEEQA